MNRRLGIPALLAAALVLTACPPKYPKCDNDDHCKAEGRTEVCVNGSCQECGKDDDCKAGFACRENKCVPKPECTMDGECRAGFKCRDQKCVPECTTDGDCAKGLQCRGGRCAPAPECLSDADCPSGRKCDPNGRCAEPVAQSGGACSLQTVRFEFNEFSLTSSARATLDKNAECLKSRKIGATLGGHADERGTEEYNLHLGEKRANAVKKYLVALGVDAGSLKTVSYGEERPANSGHDEGAWAENRRVEFSEGAAR